MLPGLTIRQAGAAFRAKTLRPSEVVAAALAQIDATEPVLHAWVVVDAERAMTAAREADADLARGIDRGPLHGVPVAVKDIIDVAGLPTRCGSPLLADAPPPADDAPVVRLLRNAGAIVLGKTVTQEFAAGVLSPPARNPWDPARVPGGSSGGSAVAVSVGAGLLALGSDTGGSVRIPAAAVGVTGFKPAFGALPVAGVRPLAPSLDTLGPLARTVDDAWIGWRVLRGEASAADAIPVEGACRGARIGFPRAHFFDRLHPDVAEAIESAAKLLRDLGADIVEADWDDAAGARAAGYLINRAETGEAVWPLVAGDPARLAMLNPDLQVRAAAGRLVPAAALDAARRVRLVARDAVARHFADHRLDAMLAPALPSGAVLADDPVIRYPDGSTEGAGVGCTRLTMPFNATGQPVLSLPCGFDRSGLPIGLQLAGRPGREQGLFELGACYEAAAGWTSRIPPVLEGAPSR